MFNDTLALAFYDEIEKIAGISNWIRSFKASRANTKAMDRFSQSARDHFSGLVASGKTNRTVDDLVEEATHFRGRGHESQDANITEFLSDKERAYNIQNGFYGKHKKKIIAGGALGAGALVLNSAAKRQAPQGQPQYIQTPQGPIEIQQGV
jgi:hypothetical protein